jgi:hypothetical protein
LPGNGSGEAFSEGASRKSALLSPGASKPAETLDDEPDPLPPEEPVPWDEIPRVRRIVEIPERRGYDSAFNADCWGEAPRFPKHPRHPDKPLTGIVSGKFSKSR